MQVHVLIVFSFSLLSLNSPQHSRNIFSDDLRSITHTISTNGHNQSHDLSDLWPTDAHENLRGKVATFLTLYQYEF
jgi:hypothetical protein